MRWEDQNASDRGDLARLTAHRSAVPGASADTRLVGVSRTGFDVAGLDVELTAEDILAAYR